MKPQTLILIALGLQAASLIFPGLVDFAQLATIGFLIAAFMMIDSVDRSRSK